MSPPLRRIPESEAARHARCTEAPYFWNQPHDLEAAILQYTPGADVFRPGESPDLWELCPSTSDVNLPGDCQRVVELDSEIPNGALRGCWIARRFLVRR